MMVGKGCDLGQVGNAEHLIAARQALQLFANGFAARPPMPMSISSKTNVRATMTSWPQTVYLTRRWP